MKLKHSLGIILIISLFFAGAIVVASDLSHGNEWADSVTWTLIAIWFVPFSIALNQAAKGHDSE